MSDSNDDRTWPFFRFGLIVTGKGEEEFLPQFFRSIAATRKCSFKVIRRINQRSPIESRCRRLRMAGSGKSIPDRDAEEIGLPARHFLRSSESTFIVMVDDLERRRSDQIQQVFERYRRALDTILEPKNIQHRASVHFLVHMLEAYYFANASVVNHVLGTELSDYEGDVETIRNPKKKLKELCGRFDEVEHGRKIVGKLDMHHVLSRKDTCSSLRTMFAWICAAIGESRSEMYQLLDGRYSDVTGNQVDALVPPNPLC